MSNSAFVMLTVTFGYAMLWSVRGRLGEGGSALASYPMGLLGITVVAIGHAVLHLPWSPASLLIGVVIVSASFAAALHLVGRGTDAGNRFRAWTAAATVAGTTVVGVVVATLQRFFVTADSWANYEPMGMRLHDTGVLFERLMEERSPLIPAMHAANRALGGELLYAAYPILGLWLIATLFWIVARHSVTEAPALARYTAAAAAAIGLACSAVFVLQSFYIHSHMVSAVFLLLGLVAFAEAQQGESPVWSAVAGLAVAGFALARPDGLSYAAVLLVIGLSATGRTGQWRRNVGPMLAGFWAPTALVYGVAFVQLGLWDTAKLSGKLAAVALAGLALLSIVAWVLLAILGSRRTTFTRAVPTLALVAATALVAVATYVRPDRFVAVLQPMMGNLFRVGGYAASWYIGVAVLGMAVCLPRLRRGSQTNWIPVTALVLFMEAAVMIHGATHLGHLGWTDSFNRIAFHALPLVWWVFGFLVASALRDIAPARTTDS